jgi:hypothetical protein
MDDSGLSGFRKVWHVVRTDGTGTDRRPDRMALLSGRLTGNLNSSDLQVESSDITLNSGIPVYSIFYIQVFLSKHRMRPIKLTSNITVRTSVSLSPDARATNMEIADSTSTVQTPALHGANARIANMEIAC